jgi:peptidyl-prolyl cis-trans isomerase-like 2
MLDSYQDPFEDYKKRLAKKLARKAEQGKSPDLAKENKESDDVNWFGVKVGNTKQRPINHATSSGSEIGKYLNLKRSIEAPVAHEAKKQRTFGFGNFDQW